MAWVDEVESMNIEYHKIEELFKDKDSNFFDTILLNGPIEADKKKLELLKDQGIEVHGVFSSYFHCFSIYQTLSFLELVNWCASNYSSSERLIMDATNSKIPCLVINLDIINNLSVLVEFMQVSKEFNEEVIFQDFREFTIERKTCFLQDLFQT